MKLYMLCEGALGREHQLDTDLIRVGEREAHFS